MFEAENTESLYSEAIQVESVEPFMSRGGGPKIPTEPCTAGHGAVRRVKGENMGEGDGWAFLLYNIIFRARGCVSYRGARQPRGSKLRSMSGRRDGKKGWRRRRRTRAHPEQRHPRKTRHVHDVSDACTDVTADLVPTAPVSALDWGKKKTRASRHRQSSRPLHPPTRTHNTHTHARRVQDGLVNVPRSFSGSVLMDSTTPFLTHTCILLYAFLSNRIAVPNFFGKVKSAKIFQAQEFLGTLIFQTEARQSLNVEFSSEQ